MKALRTVKTGVWTKVVNDGGRGYIKQMLLNTRMGVHDLLSKTRYSVFYI